MAAGLFFDYLDKRTAPYLIWTLIALVCAIYFWLTRAPQKLDDTGGASGRGITSQPAAHSRRQQVSISIDGTLLMLESSSGGSATFRLVDDAVAAAFLQLCATAEVFVFCLAESDAHEAEVGGLLESMGAFGAGLRRHRVMFSSTHAGRASMVRQLQPAIHFEAKEDIAQALEGKVPEVRLLGSAEWPTLSEGISLQSLKV